MKLLSVLHHRPKASVMLLTLVMIAIATLVVSTLVYRVTGDVKARQIKQNEDQARYSAEAGIAYAGLMLSRHSRAPELWTDNPELFQAVMVTDDGNQQWYFTIFAPNPEDPTSPRFGVIDEAGRIPLNAAPAEMLLKIPGMDEAKVDTLLDARDDDDETRPLGAEQNEYSNGTIPYLIKNGNYATIEELLLIRNFTADEIYGEDTNLSGILDPNEDDQDQSFPEDDADGQLNGGLRTWLTTFSPDGVIPTALERQKVDMNGNFRPIYALDLPGITQEFIRIHRQQIGPITHPSALLDATITTSNGRRERSGVTRRNLDYVMRNLRAQTPDTPSGLINLNTATTEVIACLPGIDQASAERIVDTRSELSEEEQETTAWLYSRRLIDADAYKQAAPYLTTNSNTFRVVCIGYGLPSGTYSVMEVVIRIELGQYKILYQRDLTHLGLPIELTDLAEGSG